MSAEVRLPSPSAARLGGDDFQHLLTWIELVRLLEPDSVVSVGFEVGQSEAGVVDDLLIRRESGRPDRYAQIKFAVDDTTPLDQGWFTTAPRSGAETPLRRFLQSYRDLSATGPAPELELITNRQMASGDPVLSLRQNISGTLVPRLFASTSAATVAARAAWAEHLGISEEEMAGFLAALVISPARGTIEQLLEAGRRAMAAAGLRGDRDGILLGVAVVRRLIEEGVRELDREGMERLVSEAGLQRAPAHSTLVVQEIAESPLAALAPASVDWVDLFAGEAPDARRRTLDPASWDDTMRPDLRRAIADLGHVERIRVEGAFRLATAFVVGFELNQRSGVELLLPGGGDDWSTVAERRPVELDPESRVIGDGDEVAVALAVSAELGADVEEFVRDTGIPVSRLLVLSPRNGVGRDSIAGAGEARGLAEEVIDHCRREAKGADLVHLFLAAPRFLAVILGSVWNRLPPTRIYADLNPGYAPTYLIET